MKRLLPLCLLILAAAPLQAADDKPFFFHKGDRVVFLGDSITEQYHYSNDIELYLTTRFPEWNILFLNAGISGDTANGGAGRFQKHVLDEKPTAITINFGMNDGGYGKFDQKRNDVYVQKTTEMLEAAKKAGVRVALVSPNCVDPRAAAPGRDFVLYRETQKQFYAPLKEIAEKNGAAFADQYAVTRAALEAMAKDDPKAATLKPFGDGFHTAPPGGLLMAHAILTGLNAPATVTNVTIEAGKAKTERCKVENLALSGTGEGVKFTRTDEAVPMPMQKDWLPLLPYMNDLKDLNYYGLTVKGLKPGKYAVTIDGQEVAQFSDEELAKGVNLGNLTTGPVYEFGQKVFTAINDKNKINKKRFRDTILNKNADQAEVPKLLEQIKEKQAEIYKMLEPKAYSYEVKLVN